MPSIAFVLFFALFITVSILAIRMDKNSVKELSDLPLNDQLKS